jgi:hypothetical protein
MTGKTFLNRVANGQTDAVALRLSLLEQTGSRYCVIGGLGVNAYAEPVVSLDLNLVVVADRVEALCEAARAKDIVIQRFEHSVNLTVRGSDLRIQLHADPRYQEFVARATRRTVLGYQMDVAAVEDTLRGKIWAYSDTQRRSSKSQKDLADIFRLVETCSELKDALPPEIAAQMGRVPVSAFVPATLPPRISCAQDRSAVRYGPREGYGWRSPCCPGSGGRYTTPGRTCLRSTPAGP